MQNTQTPGIPKTLLPPLTELIDSKAAKLAMASVPKGLGFGMPELSFRIARQNAPDPKLV